MRNLSIAIVVLALNAAACTDIEVIPKGLIGDGGGCPNPTPPDLALAQPACEAARGLAGQAVVCEDFTGAKKPAPTVQALIGQGWEFSGTKPDCWQSSAGFLEVAGFKMFSGDCKFAPPPVDLKQSKFQSIQRVTFSLIQRIDMFEPQQDARIFLGEDLAQNILFLANGNRITSRQHATITLQRSDLPGSINDVVKFVAKLRSAMPLGFQGWQIESLAVVVEP